jgi:hypothetical protein
VSKAARHRKGAAQAHPARPRASAPLIPPRAMSGFAWTIPLVAAVVVHASALRTFFAADDVTFLSRARGLEPTHWTLARPLSEGVTWRLLYAAFGLHPLPYHLFLLGLHLANTALVYAIGRRLTAGRGAACAAATLYGASSIGFAALHWTSCLVELQSATFALVAFLLYLRARDVAPGDMPGASGAVPKPGASGSSDAIRADDAAAKIAAPASASMRLLWLSALAGLASLLSKESTILFPLAFLVTDGRSGLFRSDRRTLIPGAIVALAYAAAFVVTIRSIKYVGSEAYAMTASPAFVAGNLATYLRWLVMLLNPVRDFRATLNPGALPIGGLVALVAVVLLALQLRSKRHPEEVGAAWFLAFLLPVVPLLHHTYLYYLYLPWAGACWMLAAAGQRAVRFAPVPLAWLAALVLTAFVVAEARNVRTRETWMSGVYAGDRTMRESGLLRNIVTGLDSMRFAPGTPVAFVNPAPRMHQPLGGNGTVVYSYMPFETAMRDGETTRLFFPGIRMVGVGERVKPEWETSEIVLFMGDGRLTDVGRGGRALTELGYRLMPLGQWAVSDSMFRRARALGDTLPDGTFGLMATSHYLGHDDLMREFCREFLRRWPHEKRAAITDTTLQRSLRGAPLARE